VLTYIPREKHDLTDEARRLIKSIRQMEAALVDDKPHRDSDYQDSDLNITLPLRDCITSLREKQNTVAKIHRERYEQIKSTLYQLYCLFTCH
jgi:protein regulator of cytokinesis 1